jgi:hypothetical protein
MELAMELALTQPHPLPQTVELFFLMVLPCPTMEFPKSTLAGPSNVSLWQTHKAASQNLVVGAAASITFFCVIQITHMIIYNVFAAVTPTGLLRLVLFLLLLLHKKMPLLLLLHKHSLPILTRNARPRMLATALVRCRPTVCKRDYPKMSHQAIAKQVIIAKALLENAVSFLIST